MKGSTSNDLTCRGERERKRWGEGWGGEKGGRGALDWKKFKIEDIYIYIQD